MTPKKIKTNQEKLEHPIYLAYIDGLRAIAVLSVIGFHAFPDLISGGFIGVDVFFVISGFLISSIIFNNIANGKFSFIEFYSRRIRRIFPALLLVLISCYIFGWFVLLADEYSQLGKHIAAGSGFASNLILWSESGYFDNVSNTKPLLHLWSLGIEEQFYIIWPLIIWFSWTRKFNIIYTIVFVGLASFLLNIFTLGNNPVATFYSPLSRFWELLIGSLLAYFFTYKEDFRSEQNLDLLNLLSGIGIIMIGISIAFLNKKSFFPGWWALMPTIGTALIIFSGSKAWVNRQFLSQPVMVWIGLISFPLYLWHWPLLSFYQIISSENSTNLTRIILLATSILLAYFTYLFIEKPLRHKERKVTAILMIGIIVVGYMGWNAHQRLGLDFRYRKMMPLSDEMNRDFVKWEDKGMFPKGVCNPAFFFPDAQICIQKNILEKPDSVIFGDSHAFHAYWGLSKSLAEIGHNLKLIGKGSTSPCLPFLDQKNIECRETINSQINWIVNSPEIKYVFISHRNGIENDASTRDISNFELSMRKTFDLMEGKQIIYLMSVPEPRINPRLCIGKLPLGRKISADDCNFQLKRELSLQKIYRSTANSVLMSYPNIKVYDPSEFLCPKGICRTSQDGKAMWMDSNHISESASYLQGSAIKKWLLNLSNLK